MTTFSTTVTNPTLLKPSNNLDGRNIWKRRRKQDYICKKKMRKEKGKTVYMRESFHFSKCQRN